MASSPQAIIVDSKPKLVSLLDKLSAIRPPAGLFVPPSIYCDIEGQNLGRHGTISILSLFLYPDNTAYLIDVHTLQHDAFTTANDSSTTLKGILESSEVPKGFFDIRNDSDALFSLFGIKVACIHDIQLLELARRNGPKRRVSGLARCIETDLAAAPERVGALQVISAKQDGEKIWNPRLGGTYAAFDKRPMAPAIVAYCSADVSILPSLWKVYVRGLVDDGKMFWRSQVWEKTLARIKESQGARYDPQGANKSAGPSDWQPGTVDDLMYEWFDDLADTYRIGDSYKEIAFGQLQYV
ncbi:3'-5' exonuclease [Diaporthe helianthi]|uniref:3'-5' exonuclease n=1 Tax=Diaporthe helianthi TaxID=158607 RepID=A0A2P5HEB8_DIAHE|nr:3'-5' exonuclease [Diaporthe helianthi]